MSYQQAEGNRETEERGTEEMWKWWSRILEKNYLYIRLFLGNFLFGLYKNIFFKKIKMTSKQQKTEMNGKRTEWMERDEMNGKRTGRTERTEKTKMDGKRRNERKKMKWSENNGMKTISSIRDRVCRDKRNESRKQDLLRVQVRWPEAMRILHRYFHTLTNGQGRVAGKTNHPKILEGDK